MILESDKLAIYETFEIDNFNYDFPPTEDTTAKRKTCQGCFGKKMSKYDK